MMATKNRPGGIERWLKLTDGLGLDREAVTSTRLLLPATRFAVQAYVHFVRERSLLEAVASCLTELFSPQIITERMAGMLAHYDFITPEIMSYFDQAPAAGRARCELRARMGEASMRARRSSSRRWSTRWRSSATCCGACWMRCTIRMSRRG